MHGMYVWNDLGTSTLPLASHSHAWYPVNLVIYPTHVLPQALFPHFQYS